jgi:signal transduction histidine kinase
MTTDLTTNQETVLLLLRRIHFFDGLKFEELERISNLITILAVEPGEIIFRSGDPAEAFYIIEHGRVEIVRELVTGEEVIATLGRSGDFFGEMALFEDRPRSATVRARTKCELLVLARPDFEELIRQHPSVHMEVTRSLSHNLRRSDTRFVEKLLEKNKQLAQALADLKAAQEELLKKERHSLVGRLMSGIIHDLKKPLTCISGYAQLLARKSLEDEKRQRYSQSILQEVQRLVDMTNDILNFAKGDYEISRRPIPFDAWLQEVMEFIRQDLQNSGIRCEEDIQYHGTISLDPDKFKTVFFNIAANAANAMPNGGVFKVTCKKSRGEIRMIFTDTGAGMTEEVQRRIFDDFFSHRKEGSGLGMAIVKRIVEAHQGTIQVDSVLGKGSTFEIKLPLEAA